MNRTTIVLVLTGLLAAAPAFAQTPPPTQQQQQQQQPPPPPPTQQPPPPKPAPPPLLTPPVTGKPVEAKPPVPFPPEAKVGFINLQAVVFQSKLGKQGTDKLKALQEKLTGELQAKNKELQALSEKIKSQQSVVAEATLKSWATELDRKQRELQFFQQDADVQVQQMQSELLGNFEKQVLPIVEKLREERGLWAIFAINTQESGGLGVIAAHPGIDLSSEVVKRLDATTK